MRINRFDPPPGSAGSRSNRADKTSCVNADRTNYGLNGDFHLREPDAKEALAHTFFKIIEKLDMLEKL